MVPRRGRADRAVRPGRRLASGQARDAARGARRRDARLLRPAARRRRRARAARDAVGAGGATTHDDLASMLVANTITGAAMLIRRDVAELALPFPELPGLQFHDHWLAVVALAAGDLGLRRPPALRLRPAPRARSSGGAAAGPPRRWPSPRGAFDRARRRYFFGYCAREVLARALLARCAAALTPAKRRALERVADADRSPLALARAGAARPRPRAARAHRDARQRARAACRACSGAGSSACAPTGRARTARGSTPASPTWTPRLRAAAARALAGADLSRAPLVPSSRLPGYPFRPGLTIHARPAEIPVEEHDRTSRGDRARPVVIEVRDVAKTFNVPHTQVDSIRERLSHPLLPDASRASCRRSTASPSTSTRASSSGSSGATARARARC